MNLTQAKALFFAQYLGQKVLHWDGYHSKGQYGLLNGTNLAASNSETQKAHLLLRSVNQLTDEHAKILLEICEIGHIYETDFYNKCMKNKTLFTYISTQRPLFFLECSKINSLLIRWGYLIEFTYLDETGKLVTLSVEEIIDLSWAQIKTT